MEKDQKENIQNENLAKEENNQSPEPQDQTDNHNKKGEEEKKEFTPEEKILELEDKLARTFAEMENQRRRFEKEKDEAFEYGGFSFAKEALNLIDNLERSKQILQNDESLKNSEALKKMNRALEEYVIMGINTNIQLHQKIIQTDEFKRGSYNINFMSNLIE